MHIVNRTVAKSNLILMYLNQCPHFEPGVCLLLHVCKALYCSTSIIKFCKYTHPLKAEIAEDVQYVLVIIFAVTVHCCYCSQHESASKTVIIEYVSAQS